MTDWRHNVPVDSPLYLPPDGGPNQWQQSLPESSPLFRPPASWSYVGVPYINPVQPYQGNGNQISGFEPLAMLQQYRQAGSPPLEQQAALQAAQGTSTTGGK